MSRAWRRSTGCSSAAGFTSGRPARPLRVDHLRRQPKVSLTHFVGDEVSVTVHGTATLVGRGHSDAAELDRLYTGVYGSSPFGWAENVVLIRVEPEAIYAYAPQPERFPAPPAIA